MMKIFNLLLVLLAFGISGCKIQRKSTEPTEESSIVSIQKSQAFGDKAVVNGQINDAKNNESIIFATVEIRDDKNYVYGVSSDSEGRFEIKNIPSGNYRIIIEAMGYQDLTEPIELVAGTNYTLEVQLFPEIIELEKPVIYLYPIQKQQLHVQLNYQGTITHTYPNYPENGWNITAEPNGTLWDENGMEYYALFWEGIPNTPLTANDGFVVAGNETAKFLEDKLAYLGLNRREANEFIMHWLPRMENNKFNLIHFSGSAYDDLAELKITPQPETIIRVMMLTQPLQSKIDFPEQDLRPLQKTRNGFTVVEWGGSVVDFVKENI
ncbi:MAG: carboxypeptidase-like regulatory domain-containing protein [Bacteroidales bacterium]|nr:carboxypeptidase-like regulatory domain-containing protein [Bacteroidales bacterium]